MTIRHFSEMSSAVFSGTAGTDVIDGTDEADTIHGGDGEDWLDGRDGSDLMYGELGDDHMTGGQGNDTLYGGDGNDRLEAGYGDNQLFGGAGNDELNSYLSGYGSTLLDGGDGDDVLTASPGDTVQGGAGADKVDFMSAEGTALSPTIVDGGSGNDRFILPSSDNLIEMRGGEGTDTYVLGTGGRTGLVEVLDFKAGAGGDILDVFSLDFGYEYGVEPESPFSATGYLRAVEDGDDLLLQYDRDGAEGTEYQFRTIMRLHGIDLADITVDNLTRGLRIDGTTVGLVLEGTNGDDNLEGQMWDDRISGKGGNDRITGDSGDDWLDGGDGDDTIEGGTGNDSLIGGAGADVLSAREGNDTLEGGIGNDTLYGDEPGAHVLRGGEGDDMMTGRDGGMTLDGGAGNDRIWFITNALEEPASKVATIIGGDGNDRIEVQRYASTPAVTASGGAGADVFIIDQRSEVYTITDFAAGPGGDQFDIGQLWRVAGNPFAVPAYVRLEQRGADTVLQYSPDRGTSGYRDMVILKNTNAGALTQDNFVGGASPDGSLKGLNLVGTDAEERLDGGALDDTIHGMGANDQLWGHDGRDLLHGDDGNDFIVGGLGDDTLEGGNGDDQLEDAGGNDVAYGGAGNDTIRLRADWGFTSTMFGGDGNDTLTGGMGNERLSGGAGDDRLSGGTSGLDVAIYDKPIANYTRGVVDGVYQVKDVTGVDGTDQLISIERIYFSDGAVARDLSGVGGQVYRLYQAAFNRTPDQAGLGFWIEMGDRGVGRNTMALNFMTSPEFDALYGGAPTNEALIRLFYINALHREADQAGLDFWTNVLDTGQSTAAAVLFGFSESEENIAAVAPVIANGFEYIPWF